MKETDKSSARDASIAAANRKKIEKDRRKKQYDDLQVQGTNNSSIVSKRSVELLYSTKLQPELTTWFKFFVPKGKRRSPAINRGYWIRMESIKRLVMKIINNNPTKKINIINLGCGFDPLPFQLLEIYSETRDHLCFLDIDYPELLDNKLELIKKSTEVLDILNDLQEITKEELELGMKLKSANYKILGCDLKNEKLYQEQLESMCEPESVSVFIAEVSLAYMHHQDANKIIDISSKLPNSHFLILEQILPVDKYHSFAKKMLYHFEHLRSPLKCVEHYPKIENQRERFSQWFHFIEIHDLLQNWNLLIDADTKSKVKQIEEFDEWEEFIVFCQHYTIVHATNQDSVSLYQKQTIMPPPKFTTDPTPIEVRVDENTSLELKFAASALHHGKIIIHGGLAQTRTNQVLSYDYSTGQMTPLETINPPSARMCHTLTPIANGQLLMVGGRGRPHQTFTDVYKLTDNAWVQMKSLPNGRSRHSAVSVANGKYVLICGDGDGCEKDDVFQMYNVEQNTWISLQQEHEAIPPVSSSSIVMTGEYTGVIYGGMIEDVTPEINYSIYEFEINMANHQIRLHKLDSNLQFGRIGSQSLVKENKLYIIGGILKEKPTNRFDSIITYDLIRKQFSSTDFGSDIWTHRSPTMIGFSLVTLPDQNQACIVGGGGVCYSFGSSYNSIYLIEY